jgi:hypothetical protein
MRLRALLTAGATSAALIAGVVGAAWHGEAATPSHPALHRQTATPTPAPRHPNPVTTRRTHAGALKGRSTPGGTAVRRPRPKLKPRLKPRHGTTAPKPAPTPTPAPLH